ncbi:unnamed protein product [Urochloa decumbens]|uniref:NAC domain-containing protein n=1 Tax=Urochloa decumbens TaxID=240449 RepID=A0ABC8XKQ8_9POAL
MAAAADPFCRTTDDACIALLRGLRAGTVDRRYVHRADVCAAAPEHLVANLQPVPGTDLADGGYNAVWFFYCPKRFKNAQGKLSGHRHRAIAGGDACWHSETRPKPVKGVDGATICNLSYGRKEEGSSRSFNRMGWCMTEYDDNHDGGGDHVLCKVYRSSSSVAKRKSKPMIERLSGSKRKAAADHAESLPATKMSPCFACADQEFYCVDPQVQSPLLTGHQMTTPECVEYQTQFPAEEEQVQVQHNTLLVTQQPDQQNAQSLFPAQGEPDWEQILQFLSQDTMFTIDDELRREGEDLIKEYEELISGCSCTPTAMAPPDAGFSQGLVF